MLSGIGNTSQMMSRLFTQLDTKNQGYLEKSDFSSAFSKISGGTGSSDSTSVDDVFAALDTDSDGKVSESEFSSTLTKLQEELDSQFNQMRLQGGGGQGGPQGMGGMPPPPPPNDSGFSKDELQSQLDEIGSSDSEGSSLLANIVDNFEAADSDGDGKVSFAEARAYDESSQAGSTSATASEATGSASATNSTDAQVMLKIMQLMHAYGGGFGQEQQQSGLSSLLSTTA